MSGWDTNKTYKLQWKIDLDLFRSTLEYQLVNLLVNVQTGGHRCVEIRMISTLLVNRQNYSPPGTDNDQKQEVNMNQRQDRRLFHKNIVSPVSLTF